MTHLDAVAEIDWPNYEVGHLWSIKTNVAQLLQQAGNLNTIAAFEAFENAERTAIQQCEQAVSSYGETLAIRYQLETFSQPNNQTFEHVAHPGQAAELTGLVKIFQDARTQKLVSSQSAELYSDAIKCAQESFPGSEAYDPNDGCEYLHAVKRPAKTVTSRILTAGRVLRGNDDKMLLRGNMFLGYISTVWQRKQLDDGWEIFPLELADNTELAATAFVLWNPNILSTIIGPYGRGRNAPQPPGDVYDHFHKALTAARLLLH